MQRGNRVQYVDEFGHGHIVFGVVDSVDAPSARIYVKLDRGGVVYFEGDERRRLRPIIRRRALDVVRSKR